MIVQLNAETGKLVQQELRSTHRMQQDTHWWVHKQDDSLGLLCGFCGKSVFDPVSHFLSTDQIIGIRPKCEKDRPQGSETQRREAVERALDFARHKAVSLDGVSIKELLHEGHRV